MDFADWLREELNSRQWTYAELARRSEVQTSQISRVVKRTQGAGPELCLAIAKGLSISPLEVFQARGWLPYELENFKLKLSPETVLVARQIDQLPETLRRAVLQGAKATADALRDEIEG